MYVRVPLEETEESLAKGYWRVGVHNAA